MAFDQRIGGIADHGQHAFFAQRGECGFIGRRADQGLRVQLPVPGMQDRAVRGLDHQRLGFRDGMRHPDETQFEGCEVKRPAWLDFGDRHFVPQLHLVQLAAQHRGGEGGGVNGAAQLRPQPGDRADVVLMRMGDHKPDQFVAPFGDERRVGHHPVDFRRFRPAEADAAVDRQPAPVAAIEIQIHADFTRPAQGQEGEISGTGAHLLRLNQMCAFTGEYGRGVTRCQQA